MAVGHTRKRILGLAVLAVTLSALLPARAATITITWNTWWLTATVYKQAAPGDTIEWVWTGDHNVTFYAGDMTVGNDSSAANGTTETGGIFLKAPFKKSFAGGTVLFRCTRGSNSDLSGDGLVCRGMCGGYTSRTTPPAPPVVTNLAEGAEVPGSFQIEGTAEPYIGIRISEVRPGGTLTGRTRADAFGNWQTSWLLSGSPGPRVLKVAADDILGRSTEMSIGLNLIDAPPAGSGGTVSIATDPIIALAGDHLHVEGTAAGTGRGVAVKVWDSRGVRIKTFLARCATCTATSANVEWYVDIPTGVLVDYLRPGAYVIEALVPGQTIGDRVTAFVLAANGANQAQAPVLL